MIDARDLRTGNIVSVNNELIEIKNINCIGFINEIDGVGGVDLQDCIGVHLTEKILLKCGFYNKYAEYFSIESVNQYFSTLDFLYVGVGFQVFDDSGIKVVLLESLHDLQNFYYIYNKQELQINIETLEI